MKKYLLMLFVLTSLLALPFSVNAKTKKVLGKEYETKNLVETLAEEELEKEFSNYSENDDQITIYLFRGKGCGYCRAFLSFLNSITSEYGKYYKLESFEVWYDEDNYNLMNQISYYLDKELAGGVPYIVIGDKVFPGYADTYDEDIKTAIKTLYNTSKKDRYDVFAKAEKDGLTSIEELKKMFPEENTGSENTYGETSTSSYSSKSLVKIIIWNAVFTAVTICAVGVMIYTSNKKMAELIDSKIKVKNYMQQAQSEAPKKVEVKKTVKKAKKK